MRLASVSTSGLGRRLTKDVRKIQGKPRRRIPIPLALGRGRPKPKRRVIRAPPVKNCFVPVARLRRSLFSRYDSVFDCCVDVDFPSFSFSLFRNKTDELTEILRKKSEECRRQIATYHQSYQGNPKKKSNRISRS